MPGDAAHLHTTFGDLTKAFNTLSRGRLWKIMQRFGCLEQFTRMVGQLHDRMMTRVTDKGATPEASAATNGVKQDCVLAPTLFSLPFSAVLVDAYHDERPGIRIAYRTDGHLLNSRLMQDAAVDDHGPRPALRDGCLLNTTTEVDIQQSVDLLAAGDSLEVSACVATASDGGLLWIASMSIHAAPTTFSVMANTSNVVLGAVF
nr:unnamed protein product [Spirometra erinaceieuropaei]